MDLTRIELENFGPYHNEDIDLGYSVDKKVVLIEGVNGSGKTLFLKAVQWCLFGVYSGSETDSKKADFNLFNEDVLVNSKLNQEIVCKVSLTFERKIKGSPNQKVVFWRKMAVNHIKQSESRKGAASILTQSDFDFVKSPTQPNYQDFQARYWEGNEQQPSVSNAAFLRDIYFPRLVSDYYIIYGEDFVDPSQPNKIRIAIEKNCFADTFDRISTNFDQLYSTIVREETKDKKKRELLGSLRDELGDYIAQRNDRTREIADDEKTLEGLNGVVSKLDREIGRSDSAYIQQLKTERDGTQSSINSLNAKIKSMTSQVNGESVPIYYNLLSQESQSELYEELEGMVKKGELPPNIKVTFINELIEKKKRCICGKNIDKQMKVELEKIRDESVVGENYNLLLDLKFELQSNKNSLETILNNFREKISELEGYRNNRIGMNKRLENISSELFGLKDVAELESDRTKYLRLREGLIPKLELKKAELEAAKGNIERVNTQIKKISGTLPTDGTQMLHEVVEHLNKDMAELKEGVIGSTRRDIEKYASEVYKLLFRYSSEIEGIELDSEYNVRVILSKETLKEKRHVKTKFSTGEGLIFAISFLTALRRYSGYEGPIFLDSPFSVLDEEHRNKVALNLPLSIPGQLLICTRPDTLDKEVKPKFLKFTNKSITVKKDKEWFSSVKVE
jgi:DNA sulfur modification protein DndD